jgi:prepilin peptidase CpaA
MYMLIFGVIWLLMCASYDLGWRRLPNWLTLGALIPAIGVLLISQHSVLGSSVSSALWAFALAVMLTLPAYAVGWLGAGDVKMLAAMGLLGGLPFMLTSYAIAAFSSVFVIAIIQFLQRILPYFNLKLSPFGLQIPVPALARRKFLPFGTLLGVGGIVMIIFTVINSGGL